MRKADSERELRTGDGTLDRAGRRPLWQTVVPDFRGQVLAVNRVEWLLKTVTSALDEAGVPYAVIGGNAVATWVAVRDEGAVRATKDVDLLLRRADLDRAEAALSPLGFLREEVLGTPVFLEATNPRSSQGVHVILANEIIRAGTRFAAPDVGGAVRSANGHLVIDLLALVAMKLVANRRVDQVHIEDMLRVGLIDADLAGRLPEDLLERLRFVRDTMEWFTEPPRF